jgi:multimeric flavodoxin WrbA
MFLLVYVDAVYMEVSMKILVVVDRDGADRREAGSAFAAWAAARGQEFSVLVAEEQSQKPCLGCFGCWLKTPGNCVIHGDGNAELLSALVGADLVFLVGETPYGCFSQPIKALLDRCLPLLLPFFRRFRGEMHHRLRYRALPRVVAAAMGEASEAELASYGELVDAFCDNFGSPRQKRLFRFEEGGGARPEALGAWIDEELAS